jgi:hypothetical protein
MFDDLEFELEEQFQLIDPQNAEDCQRNLNDMNGTLESLYEFLIDVDDTRASYSDYSEIPVGTTVKNENGEDEDLNRFLATYRTGVQDTLKLVKNVQKEFVGGSGYADKNAKAGDARFVVEQINPNDKTSPIEENPFIKKPIYDGLPVDDVIFKNSIRNNPYLEAGGYVTQDIEQTRIQFRDNEIDSSIDDKIETITKKYKTPINREA